MSPIPGDAVTLATLALLLGLKHGFDADHLATIDGLTRFNTRAGRPFARYCGVLFSLGHGLVVVAVAVLVALASARWQTPQWLETSGAWISIGFLTVLGLLNLRAVFAAAPHEVIAPIGLKGRWLGGLSRASRPWLVALVGALFALSFDTVSQAALFAVTATHIGGVAPAIAAGLLFLLGMLITDGLNGLWINRLISRSDEIALVASRVMSLAVGGVSLLVAAFGAAQFLSPRLETWTEGKELALGGVVVLIVVVAYVTAKRLAASGDVAARAR